MSLPFPGFGSLLFLNSEKPVDGSLGLWNKIPVVNVRRTINMACSDPGIVRISSLGNAKLSWEMYLTIERFYVYQSYMCTRATLIDWNGQSRTAMMTALVEVPIGVMIPVLAGCAEDTRMVRARVEFTETGVSQC